MYTLIGFRRLTGVSKNGNNYDFVLLYCTTKGGIGCVGNECCTLNSNYETFTDAGLSLGDSFNCSTRERNGRISVISFN